jgi:hypothetical protein
MRIRFPPQLIVFALGPALAMAIPGLPSRDHPPPIAADLTLDEDGAPSWGVRLDSRFPAGSSVETLMWELRRQGFYVEQHEELLSGGRITYAGYAWPRGAPYDQCWWVLGVNAISDDGGVIRDVYGLAGWECHSAFDTVGGIWRESSFAEGG